MKARGRRKVDRTADSDTTSAERTEGPAGPRLTPQRREILEQLGHLSAEVYEIYQAALWLVSDSSIPGRARLVSHCARELMNRLPDYLDVPTAAERVDYEGALDRIAVMWQDKTHREAIPGNLVHGLAEDSSVAANTETRVSKKLNSAIDGLVASHRRSRASREERLAGVLQPPGQPGAAFAEAQLQLFTRQWKDLGKWFAGHAHVPAPGREPVDFGECERRFEILEAMLYATLCPFYGAVEELDDILEEANRPTG